MALEISPLEIYRENIENLALRRDPLLFKNSNPDHASIVLAAIIKHSKEVRIYDDMLDGDIADRNDYITTSISNFVSNDENILKVAVRNSKKTDAKIYFLLQQLTLQYPLRVHVKEANNSFKKGVISLYEKDINFAVGDSMAIRMEEVDNSDTEKSQRKAQCSFNRPEYAIDMVRVFDLNFDSCKNIFA